MNKCCETHLRVQWVGQVTCVHVSYKVSSGALCLIGWLIKQKWKRHLLNCRVCQIYKSNHVSKHALSIKRSYWFMLYGKIVSAWRYDDAAGADGLMDDLCAHFFIYTQVSVACVDVDLPLTVPKHWASTSEQFSPFLKNVSGLTLILPTKDFINPFFTSSWKKNKKNKASQWCV